MNKETNGDLDQSAETLGHHNYSLPEGVIPKIVYLDPASSDELAEIKKKAGLNYYVGGKPGNDIYTSAGARSGAKKR